MRAVSKAEARSAGSLTTRIPRPPPPAAALTITGNPTRRASASASSTLSIVPSLPGSTGTPASIIVRRASALSPIRRIVSGRGPMKVIPHSPQISAK